MTVDIIIVYWKNYAYWYTSTLNEQSMQTNQSVQHELSNYILCMWKVSRGKSGVCFDNVMCANFHMHVCSTIFLKAIFYSVI